MSSVPNPEPDQPSLVIYVGQDKDGRWLVQGSDKRIEGRFISRSAAISFAKAEREIYHASIEIAAVPLIPIVAMDGAQADPLRRVA